MTTRDMMIEYRIEGATNPDYVGYIPASRIIRVEPDAVGCKITVSTDTSIMFIRSSESAKTIADRINQSWEEASNQAVIYETLWGKKS